MNILIKFNNYLKDRYYYTNISELLNLFRYSYAAYHIPYSMMQLKSHKNLVG